MFYKIGGGRIIGLDLLRSLAIFSVIAGHFFSLHTQYNTAVFEGLSMYLQGMVSMFFYTMGVPVFIMLTGYLNKNKVLNKGYYRSCIRVLGSYLFFSLITILFRKYYLHEDLSWMQWGLKILDFSAIPYAWYIEMWIGLYLLTPFLNLMYKAIPTQKQKLVLLASLYVITAFPDLLNRYGLHLVPGFWAQVFPLTFYFIGSYISEYKPSFEYWKLGLFIVGLLMVTPTMNAVLFSQHDYVQIVGGPWGVLGSWVAVVGFLLLYQWNTQSSVIRTVLSNVVLNDL